MHLNMIAALTHERVIGNKDSLPWNVPDDLNLFKQLTLGNTVTMGRKTYESLPDKVRPLPNRHNVVISRTMPVTPGIAICSSLEDALSKSLSYEKQIFIIGGESIYEQAISKADTMYLSFLKENYKGDAFFPEFNKEDWEIVTTQDFKDFEWRHYQRK